MKAATTVSIRIILTLLFFLLIKTAISLTILSNFAILVIDAQFSTPERFEIFYANDGKFSPRKKVRSEVFPAGERVTKRIYLKNHAVKNLRIDPGNAPADIKIYSAKLTSFYSQSLVYNPQQFYELFAPANDIGTYSLQNDHVLIRSNGNDPILHATRELRIDNTFLAWIFPAIGAFLFWTFLSSISLKLFPPIYDLDHKSSSLGTHVNALDGVRGIAALMVLAEHTGSLDGIGAVGVWLFFGLSGFLLAQPFVKDPHKAYSFTYMQQFLLRRLKRIIPMYYTFVLIIMMFHLKIPDLFRHLLFLQGDGHLWTIPQEMFFYLLLPFIMIFCCIPLLTRYFSIFTLVLLVYCANTYITKDVISLYGYGTKLTPLIGIFLSGVLFAFLREVLPTTSIYNKVSSQMGKQVLSSTALIFLIGLFVICHPDIRNTTQVHIEEYHSIVGFLTAMFIFLVTLTPGTMLCTLTSLLPFRAIGIVGYSFYLLHPSLLEFCRTSIFYFYSYKLNHIVLFFLGAVMTYLLSMLTYAYIEHPFITQRKRQ